MSPAAHELTFEELRFLLILSETRSLTVAAARQRLSMSSASRRLARLREAFGDELFVRSRLLMAPTTRMRELEAGLRRVLDGADALFDGARFDLAATRRTVHVLALDNGVSTLLSDAIGLFFDKAPKASLKIDPIDETALERMRTGEADLALFPMKEVPPDFHTLELYKTRLGVLVREGHPLISVYEDNGRLTTEDLSHYRKIEVAPVPAAHFLDVDPSPCQETAISLPYFLPVPNLIQRTDFTYLAPVMTLKGFLNDSSRPLRMLPAPADRAFFAPHIIWHHSTHEDPFLQWVRTIVIDSCRSLARELGVVEDA